MASYNIIFRSQDGKVKTREIKSWPLYHDFISEQVTALVERGLIQAGEYYKSRITPRYDDKPQFGREIVFTETPERTWLDEDMRSGWRSEAQRQGFPMRYFTLTLSTSPRGFVYKKDFPLSVLDQAIAERARGMDGNSGSLQQLRQMWQWEIVAKEEETDRLSDPLQDHQPLSLVILLGPPEITPDDNLDPLPITIEGLTSEDENALPQEPLDISIESIEIDLPIRPTVPGMRQLEGVKDTNELEILILRNVLDGIMQESRNRSEHELNGGGLLVGEAFQEESTGSPVTYITNYISASRELGAYTSTSWFKTESWDAMLRIKEERYPNKRVLGWYRDHLVGTWLSSEDELLHKHFFRESWQVLFIVDRIHATRRFYQWKGDDRIVSTNGFQIIN